MRILFDVSTTDRGLVVVLTRARWMYTSTLAYVVDPFRGTLSMAFVSTMVAVPLQDAVGDGWFARLVVVLGGSRVTKYLIKLCVWLCRFLGVCRSWR